MSTGAIRDSQPTQTETVDGTTSCSQTRLTSQTERSSSSAATDSHIHGHQQRSVAVSAGNEGEHRAALRGSLGQGQGQRSTTTAGNNGYM